MNNSTIYTHQDIQTLYILQENDLSKDVYVYRWPNGERLISKYPPLIIHVMLEVYPMNHTMPIALLRLELIAKNIKYKQHA